jgi:KaiC/GvpD/RAD55 family RecA-like ATPase
MSDAADVKAKVKEKLKQVHEEEQKKHTDKFNDAATESAAEVPLPPELATWPSVAYAEYPPPPIDWLFQDCMPRGIVGMIAAAGGTGKTMLMMHLAISLATGKPYGPFTPAQQFKVLYLIGEDPAPIVHRRLHYVAKAMGADLREIGDRFGAISVRADDWQLVKRVGTSVEPTPRYRELCQMVRAHRPDVVMLDPMARFSGGDENDNVQATYWIARIEEMATQNQLTTVIFAHHEAKTSVANGNVSAMSGRGASAIRDGARWMAALMTAEAAQRAPKAPRIVDDTMARKVVVLDIPKSNYSVPWVQRAYFERGDEGVLLPWHGHLEGVRRVADALLAYLGRVTEAESPTRRDIRAWTVEQSQHLLGIRASADLVLSAVDMLVRENSLSERKRESSGRGRPAQVLRPMTDRFETQPLKE